MSAKEHNKHNVVRIKIIYSNWARANVFHVALNILLLHKKDCIEKLHIFLKENLEYVNKTSLLSDWKCLFNRTPLPDTTFFDIILCKFAYNFYRYQVVFHL